MADAAASGQLAWALGAAPASNGRAPAEASAPSEPVCFPALPSATYAVLYADPPWDYKGQLQHAGAGSADTGGAVRHYPTVTLDDLKRLDVGSIAAPDSLLFMWATNPHLDQAIDLGKAWGFAWATVAFVWDKERVNPGFYTLSQCELCLVFKRGRIPFPRGSRNERQLIEARRGAHSTKPEEARRRIERDVPGAGEGSSCSRAAASPAGRRGGWSWRIPDVEVKRQRAAVA